MPPLHDESKPSAEHYTVAWLCALPNSEQVAALLVLDEDYADPALEFDDENSYFFGSIGDHRVVIACLPPGQPGPVSAARLIEPMGRNFPNLKIYLFVGIGGGIPNNPPCTNACDDIHLGDVVVGYSEGIGAPAVVQWDFGRYRDNGHENTSNLDKPDRRLLSALGKLITKHKAQKTTIDDHLQDIISKNAAFSRPDTDQLFDSDYQHRDSLSGDCSLCDEKRIVSRPKRDTTKVVFHQGTIVSGHSVMKNAILRDEIGHKFKVRCFEMEAAGVMDQTRCLVIRGIADYADGHKNWIWHEYAAAAAAAFAKEFLLTLRPANLENMAPKGLQLRLQEVAEAQYDIMQQVVSRKLSKDQQRCHQLFRLTSDEKDATYEWYKDRIKDRVEGTCKWVVQDQRFQQWLKQDSGPLLISADPGCGKSVLAKHLIDNELPRSASICYFFFKDQDQNTVCQTLRALLHQLYTQKPFLIEHAMKILEKDGPGLVKSTASLWMVMEQTVLDQRAGPIIIVLDALDECIESECLDLVRKVKSHFSSGKFTSVKLKYLLTCRPYENIVDKFQELLEVFPFIRIPGEDKSDEISEEINLVVQSRVKQLVKRKQLSREVEECLRSLILKVTHRTYLWVYLVFNYLEAENFKKTPRGVTAMMADTPKTVNEAYDQILKRSTDDAMVRKALSIVLAAQRPLTLSEMNMAMSIDNTTKCLSDVDLETDENFKQRLRSCCGLFISIHNQKLYFLHQTAREFLLADLQAPKIIGSALTWNRSISMQYAHFVLVDVCLRYLAILNDDRSVELGHVPDDNILLAYAADYWGLHFRQECVDDDVDLVNRAMTISNPQSRVFSVWFSKYWQAKRAASLVNVTSLMVSSYFGHQAVVKLLLEKDADLEAKDDVYGRTPLSWAAINGHEAVAQLLLHKDADLEAKDDVHGRTPLSWAAINGHEAVAQLLLHKNADLETKDKLGQTPLSWAAMSGHETIVQLLLEKDADLETKDEHGQTPLSRAAMNEHEAVV